jgi:hypothetical protein
MRYQVRVHRPQRNRRFRRPVARRTFNFASSEDLQGAFVLLAEAPFYQDLGEYCVIDDTETSKWVGIKRGRHPA